MAEIYVQIPAYRDSELPKTLQSLLRMATNASRIRIGIVWQRGPTEELPRSLITQHAIDIMEVPYQESKGCNWARNLLQQGWQGEPYTLLIDSHQRFVRGWDQLLIDMYEGLRQQHVEKPILTGYLPPYDPVNEPHGRLHKPMQIYPLDHENGLLTKLVSYPIPFWKQLDGPRPAHFVSLHFLFTTGQFNRDIIFDPGIYFFGDEVVTSLRAFTAGYDLFHPHRVVGWHAYDRRTRTPHWADHATWTDQEKISSERIRSLYEGQLTGRYGLGTVRSRKAYETYIFRTLISHEAID